LLVRSVRFLQHRVQLFLLIIIQHGACFGDRGLTQAADLLDFIFTRQRVVIDDCHCLLVLVLKHILQLGLLVGCEIQLLGKHSHLIVDAGPARLLLCLRLRWLLRLRAL
jgi:hypothetical protein